MRPVRCWVRCAPSARPSDRPGDAAWEGCGETRRWGSGSKISASASAGSSSQTARVATSAWCRSRPRSSATVADYMETERPVDSPTDRLFVVLKGPRRGMALSSEGLDEVMAAARKRAGLVHGTCHELRHTCFTRLREAGMSLEALQAQAGHRSIASTQVYLHLGADWLAAEYRSAADSHRRRPGGGGPVMDGTFANDPMTPPAAAPVPVTPFDPRRPNAVWTWTQIAFWAPGLAATMTNYLAQIAISSRPGTVEAASLALRVFAGHLIETDAECTCVADITRSHIESFKLALAKTSGQELGFARHRPPSATSSAWCAPSSSASSSGTTPTHPGRSRSSPGTSPRPTSRCRTSLTTRPPPNSWPPWPKTPTCAGA